jgi:hypothetical protein
MEERLNNVGIPDLVFEQPLFQSERIAAGWERMRAQITSATQLEAAYKIVAPEIEGLRMELEDADVQQVLDLYNMTVTDGRYLRDLMTDPAGVAEKLRVPLSAAAEAAIKQVGNTRAIQTMDREQAAPVVVAVVVVAVVVVIVFGPKEPRRRTVVDSSGIVKM